MNFSEIKELINIIDKSSLTEIELKNSAIYLRMNKNKTAGTEKISVKENLENNFSDISDIIEKEIPKPQEITKTEGFFVKSPIVGTFYAAASPDKPPFVSVGDIVKKGQVLCIIEAMKVMNEVLCEQEGRIEQIYVKNEDMVEYDQNLFRIV